MSPGTTLHGYRPLATTLLARPKLRGVPRHLRPSAAIAADALLPGDPGRALALAQDLLESPKMSNHARGLWGYWGETGTGAELTIQSTGIGGPSAAVVLGELAELGVRRAIRLGTCVGAGAGMRLGELLAAEAAVAEDGVSRALGAAASVAPDPELGLAVAVAAREAGGRAARVVSTDLAYELGGSARRDWPAEVDAVDLATAPLLALGQRLGVATASLLVVAELPGPEGAVIEDEDLAQAALGMGRAAAAALSS
jgi:uridine phosphorylase